METMMQRATWTDERLDDLNRAEAASPGLTLASLKLTLASIR